MLMKKVLITLQQTTTNITYDLQLTFIA